MLPLFTKRQKTTLSFATSRKVARRSKKFAESLLTFIVLLTLQDVGLYPTAPQQSRIGVKRSELQHLKWSQLHLDVSQLDEKLIDTTNEEWLIRAHSRLENSRTLRLQESDARSKGNALDY